MLTGIWLPALGGYAGCCLATPLSLLLELMGGGWKGGGGRLLCSSLARQLLAEVPQKEWGNKPPPFPICLRGPCWAGVWLGARVYPHSLLSPKVWQGLLSLHPPVSTLWLGPLQARVGG